MPEAPALVARHKKWLLCLAIAACALALTYWPQGLLHFRYERQALAQGEIWRLVSAHFVHVGARHLLLNLAGLFLLFELLWDQLPLRHGAGMLIATAAGIDALFWVWHPELQWYAGLSGLLHGLWAGCALALWRPVFHRTTTATRAGNDRRAPAWIGLAALLLLSAKLVAEALDGNASPPRPAIGAPVIEAAHLYGALLGAGYVVAWQAWARRHRNA